MYKRKFKPSKQRVKEFVSKMDEIHAFCKKNNIDHPYSCDSYYFVLNGISYRVSNHSIEASNKHAYNSVGEQVRDKYHPDQRQEDVVYIHASKTRIIEIYMDLKAGYKLDGRGNRKG